MSYIGAIPATTFTKVTSQVINGNGGATYTLDKPVNRAEELEVFVENVQQQPTVAYTASGTSLVFTANVASATGNIYVIFRGLAEASTYDANAPRLIGDNTLTGDQTITGDTSLKGNVVVNEDSADKDFRVESNSNTHMLFVDGGNDTVGIGISNPADYTEHSDDLVVGGSTGNRGITIIGAANGYSNISLNRSTNTTTTPNGAVEYNHTDNQMYIKANGNHCLQLNSDGSVNKPNQPMLYTHGDTTRINVANGYATGTYHTLLWASPQINVGNDFANNVYTCPVAGKYKVDVQATIYGNNGGYVAISIVKNSSQMTILYWDTGTLALWQTIANSLYINASANDTIYARVYYTASSHQVHEGSYRTLSIALVA